MPEHATSAPLRPQAFRVRRGERRGSLQSHSRRPWLIVALAVVLISTVFVVWSHMRPEFDAYGWIVWGQRALHLDLNTNSAPSWKPLPFLFTYPYAVFGHAAMWLWMVTAVAGALAGPVFAARIAYRVVGDVPGRGYARIIAAAFAAAGVIGIVGYWHLVLVAASDPIDITLALGAVDCHLAGRRRMAWLLLVLLSLARPDAWTVSGLYALWAWRAVPPMRRLLVAGVILIPVLWFGIPALTSPSWFISSDVALESIKGFPGTALSRLPGNFLGLYELPMKLAVVFALVLAALRRDRVWLLLAGAAGVWFATWVGLAWHGWNPSPRYMYEAAALLIVVTAAATGWLLAASSRRALLRLAPVAGLVGLVVALAPPAQTRARDARSRIAFNHGWSRQLDRLHDVVAKLGPKRIVACGQSASTYGFQPILAWELDENIADVAWDPDAAIKSGMPMVLFQPVGWGWKVIPMHTHRLGCRRMATQTSFS